MHAYTHTYTKYSKLKAVHSVKSQKENKKDGALRLCPRSEYEGFNEDWGSREVMCWGELQGITGRRGRELGLASGVQYGGEAERQCSCLLTDK